MSDQHPHDGQTEMMPAPSSHYPVVAFANKMLDRGGILVYAIVGICIFLAGLFALGYSFWHFWDTLANIPRALAQAAAHHEPTTSHDIVAGAIVQLISDQLLVLIIMEVLGTITHYLKVHTTSLNPFLFIGIVSATRGILSIGARLSIFGTEVLPQEFDHAMIELSVNAAVILALGITLKLLGKPSSD